MKSLNPITLGDTIQPFALGRSGDRNQPEWMIGIAGIRTCPRTRTTVVPAKCCRSAHGRKIRRQTCPNVNLHLASDYRSCGYVVVSESTKIWHLRLPVHVNQSGMRCRCTEYVQHESQTACSYFTIHVFISYSAKITLSSEANSVPDKAKSGVSCIAPITVIGFVKNTDTKLG